MAGWGIRGRLFTLVLFALPFQPAQAANHALLVGGGCEPINESRTSSNSCASSDPTCAIDSSGPGAGHYNLFRPNFNSAHRALTLNGWQVRTQYDSDQWERPWPGAQASTRQGLRGQMQAYSTSLTSGDQLLIGIATHGGHSPHTVCLGDGTSFPVSELATYIQILRGRGVRVAVIDSSCYSGQSVDALAGSGACVLAGTNSDTTGAGDGVWAFTFGQGLPRGEAIPSFYNESMPTGNADLSGDGRISASEAFYFANVHMTAQMVPRTSDCSLNGGNIRSVLDRAARILRSEYDADEEMPYEEWQGGDMGQRPTAGNVCALRALPDMFRSVLATVSDSRRVTIHQELETLGVDPFHRDIRTAQALLASFVLALESGIRRSGEIQDQIDDLMKRREPVPDQLRERLREMESATGTVKQHVMKHLRPLVYMLCSEERARRGERSSCDEFDLFPARSQT